MNKSNTTRTALLHFAVSFFTVLLFFAPLAAQRPAKPSASDLHEAIKKLNVLGSVLYVAAHPDDENQRFISYCANEKLFNVTYLSLTRGDGGQNLIGSELSELLGVLRTQELLMARAIDGGRQRFSRANDFGYSKTPDETLTIWNKDAVLSDLVWAIRETQPDVIVNRFSHDKNTRTHGHHTASAMLAVEGFDLAGKIDAYSDQLKFTTPWQPKRVFFNTSWWFFGGREAFEKADKSHLFSIDGGVYLPLKGKSNSEVAAEARSMHRCQGFGAMSSRGEALEYFDLAAGDRPQSNDLFEGINTTWTRVPGGEPVGKLLADVEKNYRPDNPAASVPDLLRALKLVEALPDGHWKKIKRAEIKEVIRGCLGLYLEATAAEATATPGDPVALRLECIYRGALPGAGAVALNSLSVLPGIFDTAVAQILDRNKGWVLGKTVQLPDNIGSTAPYWLRQSYSSGMYTVDDQLLRGLPETPRHFKVRWTVSVNGTPLDYETEVAYKIEEPAIGEVWRPFDILPPAFVELTESCYLVTEGKIPVTVRVKANRDNLTCRLKLLSPAGWPNSHSATNPPEFVIAKKGEEREYTFQLEAYSGPDQITLTAGVEIGTTTYVNRLVTIKYDHIPQQYVLLPAEARAARLNMGVTAKNVGYYMGAGDDGPQALRRMGCTVTNLEDKDFTTENLKKLDAVVLGIRAYNTREELKQHQAKLFEYVQNGGTLVTQYNNNFDLVVQDVAPLPLQLGRVRVTDETAEIRFLNPEHPALNTPNKITARDFDGWVQERGLYFPGKWDDQYVALLGANDPGEERADGSLLVAKYGQGHFVYTGLAFFRQFPAGVPGAYRLFANLISLK
ncbi:MAG: PIG-L family deacetylase [Lewinellaceae bacterium]|nr:PIG-L family deacetylase [Lewinellaceae bacterium]